MLEIINFYFLNKYAVEIWLVFSILFSSFVLFYNSKIRLTQESYKSFNDKINYYIILFWVAIFISLFKPICIFLNLSNCKSENYFTEIFSSFNFLSWLKIFFLFICVYFYYLLKIYVNIDKKILNVEILILLSFSMLGLFLIFSSPDLIWFYLSLELYSLSVYCFLFVFNYSYLSSSIKYFIMGSISSLILLFSLTVIYFYTGTVDMESLSLFFFNYNYVDLNDPVAFAHNIFFLIFGLGLFLISFGLKLGLAPLHAWSIDVYSNQSYYSTFFLLTLPKLTFVTFLINFFYSVIPSVLNNNFLYSIIFIFAVMSTLVGAAGVINQTNIKKIFLYSSLGNMVFLLMPLLNPSPETLSNFFIFLFFYFFNLVIILTTLLYLRDSSTNNSIQRIDHLCSLFQSHPYLAFIFSICLLSLSGIPPMIGFFTKIYFLQTLFSLSIFLFLVVFVCNTIMLYYSLKIIKLISYQKGGSICLIPNMSWKSASLMLIFSIILNIVSVFYISAVYAFANSIIFVI